MKIENVLAVMVAVLATGLASSGQTPTQPPPPAAPSSGVSAPQVPSGPATPGTTTPAPEPTPPALPEGRPVDYGQVTGSMAASNNVPASDEIVDVVAFDGVPLTDALSTLALQAGINIMVDPNLLNGPDGHPIPSPQITQKWKKITAMQALQALLENYGWQMTWNPLLKVGRISLKDKAAKEPLVFKVIQLNYANPTNMVKEIESSLSTGSAIIADMRSHQLVIRTTEKELAGVQVLISQLDKATRQVLVEAKIVETSKDITTAKGVDWTGTLAAQHVSFGNGLTQSSTSTLNSSGTGTGTGTGTVSPGGSAITGGSSALSSNATSTINTISSILPGSSQQSGFSMSTAHGLTPATAFLNADGLQAVLSFLNTDSDSKTIAFPRSVALDGQATELAVIQNIPIFQQTQSAPAAGAAQGLATIQPNYDLKVENTILNQVGVVLVVTPRIAGPTNVLMELHPEISEQGATVTETLNGSVNQAPSFSRSRIVTSASVPSGYTLVLGGMDQDVVNKAFTKVPFFGDLPGLGGLFRSDSKSHSAQSILIFVTPTIISEGDFQNTPTGFLKTVPDSPKGMHESAWNSGEPYDWTKPQSKNNNVPDERP